MPDKLLFLPGASGNTGFWHGLADRLACPAPRHHFGWPGFGATPPDPAVRGFDDLVARVVAEIDRPVALVAQSMGGVIALRAALQRPSLVTHLVLAATSGGLPMAELGAEDWRPAFAAAHPSLPAWFADERGDLTSRLPEIAVPTLLLWGDSDPISPVAAGQRLASLLPAAELRVFPGGDHDFGDVLAAQIAPWVDAHLAREACLR